MNYEGICCGLKVGQQVPDFEMDTFDPTEGYFGKVSFKDLREAGKWTILFFYPADFTFVCATEFAALAEQYEKFREPGAEVVTVSTDTQFTHLAWHRDETSLKSVRYPMAADPTGAVSRLFGVYNEATGLDLRGTFIISPDGTLMNAEINFYNLGRNIDELMRKLKANIYLAEHGDEACPAKWQGEGDKTLTPSERLVGKVHEALE
jgi:peroxiredoxin (alkyl hydroperoxide reductase subunit C)